MNLVMDEPVVDETANEIANFKDTQTGRLNYRGAEAAQFTQAAIDFKIKWSMINAEHNVKGTITGLLSKFEEKYRIGS